MRVHLFVTSTPGRSSLEDPILMIPDGREEPLPPHPQSLQWRYFATTTTDDALVVARKRQAEAALASSGHFIFEQAPAAAH